jgi:hypothetical protein
VTLLDDNQNEANRKAVKNLNPKKWDFQFFAFGDDAIAGLDTKFAELSELAEETKSALKEFYEATLKQDVWKGAKPTLEPKLKALRKKCQNSQLVQFYPAAVSEIYYTVQNLHQNLDYLQFTPEGKFAGAKDYHAGDSQVKTHRNDPYSHESFRRYVEEAPLIAGRELCLWVIKDFQRAQNTLRPEVAELVKRMATYPGIAEFAERLQALTAESVKDLEKDVRESKFGPAPDKDNKDKK